MIQEINITFIIMVFSSTFFDLSLILANTPVIRGIVKVKTNIGDISEWLFVVNITPNGMVTLKRPSRECLIFGANIHRRMSAKFTIMVPIILCNFIFFGDFV